MNSKIKNIINKINYFLSYIQRKKSSKYYKLKNNKIIFIKSDLTYHEKKHNKNNLSNLTCEDKIKILSIFLKEHNLFYIIPCWFKFFFKGSNQYDYKRFLLMHFDDFFTNLEKHQFVFFKSVRLNLLLDEEYSIFIKIKNEWKTFIESLK